MKAEGVKKVSSMNSPCDSRTLSGDISDICGLRIDGIIFEYVIPWPF